MVEHCYYWQSDRGMRRGVQAPEINSGDSPRVSAEVGPRADDRTGRTSSAVKRQNQPLRKGTPTFAPSLKGGVPLTITQ